MHCMRQMFIKFLLVRYQLISGSRNGNGTGRPPLRLFCAAPHRNRSPPPPPPPRYPGGVLVALINGGTGSAARAP